MVPLPIIGLALEFGDLLFMVDEPAELPIPVVAFEPLVETEGLLLFAVVPMPFGDVLAVDPVPQGCGFWPSVLLLRPVPVVVPPGDMPAPPAPRLPDVPAEAPALPPAPPPLACANAAVLPAARKAAVTIASD